MTGGREAAIPKFEQRIDYRFRDRDLLLNALTHPSAVSDRRPGDGPGYEQLEFLGDRALGLAVAELLMERFPKEDEGALSKRHTALVRKEALVEVARLIDLDSMIVQSSGEGRAYRRQRETVSADGVEALIAAIFLDGGFDAARRFIRKWWTDLLQRFTAPPKDPKTALQEWAQARSLPLPAYAVLEADGPDHTPRFLVEAAVDGHPAATGEGRSKRKAEQAAAEALLRRLEGGPE